MEHRGVILCRGTPVVDRTEICPRRKKSRRRLVITKSDGEHQCRSASGIPCVHIHAVRTKAATTSDIPYAAALCRLIVSLGDRPADLGDLRHVPASISWVTATRSPLVALNKVIRYRCVHFLKRKTDKKYPKNTETVRSSKEQTVSVV